MPAYELTDSEFRREQRGVLRGSMAAILVCAVVLGMAHLLLPRLIRFPAGDLDSVLTFWAGSSLFVVFWIMVGVRMVSKGRRHSAQDIRGAAYAAPSPRIAVPAAFLQNTLEQAVVLMVTQFAMLMVLRDVAMPLILASVVLFSVGRVAFFVSYPKGAAARSFGMALTAVPSVVAFVLALCALVRRIWP